MSDDILKQAYTHPKFAAMLFDTDLLCPTCRCEYVFVIRRELGRKVLLCQHCGLTFKEDVKVA